MPFRRAINLVWYFLTRNGTQKGIDRLKADLIRPLPGMHREVSEGVVQQELDMFKKAMETMQGGGKK